jgi:hypothetical protein
VGADTTAARELSRDEIAQELCASTQPQGWKNNSGAPPGLHEQGTRRTVWPICRCAGVRGSRKNVVVNFDQPIPCYSRSWTIPIASPPTCRSTNAASAWWKTMGNLRDWWKYRRRRQAARVGSPSSTRGEPDNGMAAILSPLHPLNPLSPLNPASSAWPDDKPPVDSTTSRDPHYGPHHDPATHHTDTDVSHHHDSGGGHSGHSDGGASSSGSHDNGSSSPAPMPIPLRRPMPVRAMAVAVAVTVTPKLVAPTAEVSRRQGTAPRRTPRRHRYPSPPRLPADVQPRFI